ncbi:hypothetical protein [Aliiglaciecola litoralis]|uniref:Uncharacterized protein n=1 Tax=Aliiglaciecola litoralis TaxID=582857 RepID=A0ABP3X2Z6_9ALTE
MLRSYILIAGALGMLISPMLNAQSTWLTRNSLTLPTNKQKDYGIGVIFVELNQHNVSAIVQRVDEDSVAKSITNKDALDLEGKPIKLDFTGTTGFVTVNLPEGLYQITQVDVPHFDLPFKVSTDNSDIWRFRVKPGHINYLGLLEVGAVRAKDNVNVAWLNRFATHLDELLAAINASTIEWPLAHGVGYQDDFSLLLEQPIK